MRRSLALAVVAAIAVPSAAHALCGMYVAGSDAPLVNDATQVVVMRKGTRTVVSIQNNYKGPPEAFAMIVPVPVVLHEGDVKTLAKDAFAHVDTVGAPRLVEYWEQDPCAPDGDHRPMPGTVAARAGVVGVAVEATFAAGEYQIAILSAKDSASLDSWLRQENYTVPADAEPLLRPYVESGSKFIVAKVDPTKLTFENGQAVLSPLRFHYDADELSLPIRLGLVNSAGTQDLIVNILAPAQRYDVANYPNSTVPTNIDVKPAVKGRFDAFYAALFAATLDAHKGAVVTEYAGPALDEHDLTTLGADVLDGPRDKPAPYRGADFVLTRVHARYGKDVEHDLVFEPAAPIAGGREVRGPDGTPEEGARPGDVNAFEGRYTIRHAWRGPITCNNPVRHRWGGPPRGAVAEPAPSPPPGDLQLAASVVRDVPELDLHPGASPPEPIPAVAAPPPAADTKTPKKSKTGCGCQTTDGGDGWAVVGIAGLVAFGIRRRRTR